jgi:hypothetical protein
MIRPVLVAGTLVLKGHLLPALDSIFDAKDNRTSATPACARP